MQDYTRLIIWPAALLTIVGCGNQDTVRVETPAQAATQIEQAFATADAEPKQSAGAIASALKTRDYEKAYVVLQTVQYRQDLTYEQAMAARNSMFTLQHQLAEASLRGDTNAQRVIQMIRLTQPH
ncbi:MAG: hypothetical protein HY298_18950 [Verrucomicrobia bacterium]|nr:hypothetical protein [Verrucomicrobiota bacterium]